MQQETDSHGEKNQIMDLGMLSSEVRGSKGAVVRVFWLFTLFVFVSAVVGLRYAVIAFALAGPIVLMEGKSRFLVSVLSTSVVGIFALVVADHLMAVIWPEPILWHWLGSTSS
jgi:hypothetical protein